MCQLNPVTQVAYGLDMQIIGAAPAGTGATGAAGSMFAHSVPVFPHTLAASSSLA